MDKEDFKYIIKTALIILLVYFGIIACIAGVLFFNYSEKYDNYLNAFCSILFWKLGIVIIIGLVLSIGVASIFGVLRAKRKNDAIKFSMYIRELPNNFPPAIASILIDPNIETYTEYIATITYLMSKKYIEIDEHNEKVNILNSDISNLLEHEKYVFECITENQKIDEKELRVRIIHDAEKMEMIKKGKKIAKSLEDVYYLTKVGKEEARKFFELKNFIRGYTLTSSRNLFSIKLFDSYVPYAIALGEVESIEDYIEKNKKYRALIYGNLCNY